MPINCEVTIARQQPHLSDAQAVPWDHAVRFQVVSRSPQTLRRNHRALDTTVLIPPHESSAQESPARLVPGVGARFLYQTDRGAARTAVPDAWRRRTHTLHSD